MTVRVLVLVFAVATCTQAQTRQSGTYFVFENNVFPSYSSWLVSYLVDLSPYNHALGSLFEQLNELENSLHSQIVTNNATANTFYHNSKEMHNALVKYVGVEVQQLKSDFERIQANFHETVKILTEKPQTEERKKRAALNIVGDLMSDLFGVSTHKQLRKVKRTLIRLENNQEQVVHVLKESLTLLNKTNEEISANRDALIEVTDAVNLMQSEIRYMRSLYASTSQVFQIYGKLYIRIQSLFNVINIVMRDTQLKLIQLSQNIQTIASGNLPMSLFPPNLLYNTLNEILHNLNASQALPIDLQFENLIHYYRFIKPSLIQLENKFLVIFAIPITDTQHEYFLFKFVQVPSPNSDKTLMAEYVPENEFLVISADRKYYSLLPKSELESCKSTPICVFHSPILSTEKSPSCLTALFLHQTNKIHDTCRTVISQATRRPTIKTLIDRRYLISTTFPITGTRSCDNNFRKTFAFSVVKGISIFEVPDGCHVKTEYFEIPAKFHGTTNVVRESQFELELELQMFRPDIWEDSNLAILDNMTNSMKDLHKINLQKIEKLPIDRLEHVISSKINSNRSSDNVEYRVFAPWIVGLTVAIILIVLGLVIYKYFQRVTKIFTCACACNRDKKQRQPPIELTERNKESAAAAETLTELLCSSRAST